MAKKTHWKIGRLRIRKPGVTDEDIKRAAREKIAPKEEALRKKYKSRQGNGRS
jgi:hypothetical protein